MLIIVMGLPGAGKTYFAKAFAEKIGALHTNSDTIRKTLFEQPNYDAKDKAIVYNALFDFVTQGLKAGKDVIIDATFSKKAYRQPYFDFADQHHVPCFVILMEADESVIKQRVQKKRPDSDADFEVYLKIKAEFEKLERDYLLLRSDTISLAEMLDKAEQYIQPEIKNGLTDTSILQLVANGKFPNDAEKHQLVETHISWVILGEDFVYKIKKPVKFSFLDFSTIEKRKYFCEQELILSQRLTHDVYLSVQPITFYLNQYEIGSRRGDVVDYAVVMRRMDNTKEMKKLLSCGKVNSSDIQKIADQLVVFHRNADVIKGKVKAESLNEDFQDLLQIKEFVNQN
ncbi:MAG: AAA family ATPase, partial [Chitinophagales bacterium]